MKKVIVGLMVAMGVGAAMAGNSCVIRLDTRVGMVTPKATETLTFDAKWGDGASSVVKVDGVTLEDASGAGSVEWIPSAASAGKVWTVTWTCGNETLTRQFGTLDHVKKEMGTNTFARVTANAEMITPKLMRVNYTVHSNLPEADVNAVAFKDGVRSFANVVRMTKASEGQIVGTVPTHQQQSFVWDVSADWDTELDKVAVEVMAKPGDLLPQQKVTIPANGDNPAMTITRNAVPSATLFNALLWCYAEGDPELTVVNGDVAAFGGPVAQNDRIVTRAMLPLTFQGRVYGYFNDGRVLDYLYGKMGYERLTGADLEYARKMTRLDLKSSGIEQVAKKRE